MSVMNKVMVPFQDMELTSELGLGFRACSSLVYGKTLKV